jgi:hypothetical protein
MKTLVRTILAIALTVSSTLRAAGPEITVYKTPTCGCCGKWVELLKDSGFVVTVHDVPDTAEYRRKFGVPENLRSCHTAVVGGYAIEGHVPVREILRLLQTAPADAKGLSVPGMPSGSPGMEGARNDPYSVLLFDSKGGSTVYQKYPSK